MGRFSDASGHEVVYWSKWYALAIAFNGTFGASSQVCQPYSSFLLSYMVSSLGRGSGYALQEPGILPLPSFPVVINLGT